MIKSLRTACNRLAAVTVVLVLASALCTAAPIYTPQPTLMPKPDTTWIASPNFNSRNGVAEIDSIVIHTTEETLASTIDIFLNPVREVSAHFVVAPNGDIYQMVDTQKRAWHATYYNHRSIGIEVVGYANQASTWNANNVNALTDLLAWLMQAYPKIPLTHPTGNAYNYPNDSFNATGLVAHGQVQPWNRSDPGPYFPWNQVLTDVATKLAAVPEPASIALILIAGILGISRLAYRS
jgi:N-acetyl-anhydromuramyl-L-alanine amidase AmpD